MPEFELKSAQFRREREQGWRELEGLIDRVERSGLAALPPGELARLPMLYRAALSSLSVARSISLDRALLLYLEGLATRAYLCVYGSHASLAEALAGFFARRLPTAVRAARWHILAAGLCLALGIAAGWAMVAADPDAFYGFVDDAMAAGRTPAASTESLRAALYDSPDAVEELTLFASFLFSHNAAIGMLAFALGFALGVPTVILLFVNGLGLGAFLALYDSRGLLAELVAWLAIHGTTELFAIVLCGAGGLMIAEGVVFPGARSRLANLARQGREAAMLVAGAVPMLLVAGLLEGLGRQLVTDPATRLAVGLGALALWIAYFARVGRKPAG